MDNNINESEFRNNVFSELNLIRTSPKAYAQKLKEYMKCFKGKVLRLSGTSVMTNEGASAFKEASEFLEKATPIKALNLNPSLTNVASDYLKEIEKYEDLEEVRDIDIQAIIDKYGYFSGEFRQSTDFGSSTPEMIAINIIVDDGDRDREMRKVLFTEGIKQLGVSMGNHPMYNYCTVLLFTSKFNVNSEEDKEKEKAKEIEVENSKEIIDQANKTEREEKNDKSKIKEKSNSNKEIENQNENDEDEDLDLPEDVVKMERNERIVTEKGVKKKIIKKIYYKEDGSKHIEVTKEIVNK